MVRCFIGIFIPNELKQRIIDIQNEIKKLPLVCKFVEPKNLHISLSFLGEIEEEETKNIGDKLNSICNKYEKFDVNVLGIKSIPSKAYIRVIVLDIFDDNNYLKQISNEIQKEIGGDAKPPHLTLCRVKSVINKEKLLTGLSKYENESFGQFKITNISLIKSELRKPHPIYSVIRECKLS